MKRIVLILLLTAAALFGQRTDVIVMKNGDRITGAIRSVGQGILQLKSDHGSGRYDIYWDHVDHIESTKQIAVELSNGQRIRGRLTQQPDAPDKYVIRNDRGQEATFTLPEVSTMHEGEPGFLGRWDGSLDIGYSLTKSNDNQQLSTDGTLIYNADRYVANLALSYLFSNQKDAESSVRYEAGGYFRQLLSHRWFGFGGARFLHSDELQLSLRSVPVGGVGRYLKRDAHHLISIGAGMAWNHETFIDPSTPSASSAEAAVNTQLNVYEILGDKLSLINEFTVFKSVSHGSRVRVDFESEMRYSLPKHFYFNFKFTDNFDSAPIGNAPTNDFVFSTGFGWAP